MAIEVHPEPFKFVNYLRVKEWGDTHTLDVGFLSPAQASEYWRELEKAWVDHCGRRHQMITEDLREKAASANNPGGGK
jgi:hypothetical protein